MNQEYPGKTTDLKQVNDKPYHIKYYRVVGESRTQIFIMMIETDCIGRCRYVIGKLIKILHRYSDLLLFIDLNREILVYSKD